MTVIFEKVKEAFLPAPISVAQVVKFRAYKDGKCEIFKSRKEAEKFSNMIESFAENLEEYTKAAEEYSKWYNSVHDAWYKAIRDEFREQYQNTALLSCFQEIYNQAEERADGSGHDEVYYYFKHYTFFAAEILKVVGVK
jgi:dsDNA-binding SOS-regulon protein